MGPHQGNFGYDAQGHGHYPSEVPASNAAMLRGPLDDVWPAPNQHGVSQGQVRQPSDASWQVLLSSHLTQRFWL